MYTHTGKVWIFRRGWMTKLGVAYPWGNCSSAAMRGQAVTRHLKWPNMYSINWYYKPVCVCVYIYRERERDRYIYMAVFTQSKTTTNNQLSYCISLALCANSTVGSAICIFCTTDANHPKSACPLNAVHCGCEHAHTVWRADLLCHVISHFVWPSFNLFTNVPSGVRFLLYAFHPQIYMF